MVEGLKLHIQQTEAVGVSFRGVQGVIQFRLGADQEAALTAIIQRKLGHPFQLRFEYFADRLPVGPGGKFEEFLCMI